MAGQQRRLYDPTVQIHNLTTQPLSPWQFASALGLFLFQFVFLYNFIKSMRSGEKPGENPWEATTLEWACPSPPGHGNFAKMPTVYRGPYEYSIPGAKTDWSPQHVK
jgi:cytochrome c oxidase subunit I